MSRLFPLFSLRVRGERRLTSDACLRGCRYKARGAYESILPYLDRCHAEQIEQGVVSEDDTTSAFPF